MADSKSVVTESDVKETTVEQNVSKKRTVIESIESPTSKKWKGDDFEQNVARAKSFREEHEQLFESLVVDSTSIRLPVGFIEGHVMNTSARIFVNKSLQDLLTEEYCMAQTRPESRVGSLAAMVQSCNIATLPGIVGEVIGLPDIHAGYGFAIGNVAAFDVSKPDSIVSPGGVGFDICCGVRMIRTNLNMNHPKWKNSSKKLFEKLKSIPINNGQKGIIDSKSIEEVMTRGIEWAVEKGFAYAEDRECCEERGMLSNAEPKNVSGKAVARGVKQFGSVGTGNHYIEIQEVEEIREKDLAKAFGIEKVGQIVIMMHSGSRGFGHQICADYVKELTEDNANPENENYLDIADPQLACAKINSEMGQKYLKAMSCACNYAWANRSWLTHYVRREFENSLRMKKEDLGMSLVYDVSHNVAKVEPHKIDGEMKECLVHRKGSTRALPPHHPILPPRFKETGQPVLVGGSMGTASWLLVGTNTDASRAAFHSTCHGAGRALSRSSAERNLKVDEIRRVLDDRGVNVKCSKDNLRAEAPQAYKDIETVISICEKAGLSTPVAKLKPLYVIKG